MFPQVHWAVLYVTLSKGCLLKAVFILKTVGSLIICTRWCEKRQRNTVLLKAFTQKHVIGNTSPHKTKICLKVIGYNIFIINHWKHLKAHIILKVLLRKTTSALPCQKSQYFFRIIFSSDCCSFSLWYHLQMLGPTSHGISIFSFSRSGKLWSFISGHGK